jgi:hypothetical protein
MSIILITVLAIIGFLPFGLIRNIGIGVEHINKEAVAELARSVFGSFSSLVFTTVSVNGTRNFTAWEWVSLTSSFLGGR